MISTEKNKQIYLTELFDLLLGYKIKYSKKQLKII